MQLDPQSPPPPLSQTAAQIAALPPSSAIPEIFQNAATPNLNRIDALPERLLAAKFALWSGLLTANALIMAGVIAWVYSMPKHSSIGLMIIATASILGVLSPVYCLTTVAAAEAEAAGIPGWHGLKGFRSIRVKLWGTLELISAFCLMGSFIHLMWEISSGA